MGATSTAGGNGSTAGAGGGPARGARRLRTVAATVALAALLALTAAPSVGAQDQPAKKLSFTVGIINDVDSLNPFIGILA